MSFKDAASELSITPSAVSHQIKNLESQLGIELFRRLTRALEFTEAGNKYFDFLDTMFERLESETRQIQREISREIVRLCAPPFFAEEAILPRLLSFQDSSPHTDIRVSTQPSAVPGHPADADVSILLGEPASQKLRIHRLFERKLVVACSPKYLKKHRIKSYKDLDGHTLLVHERWPDAWDDWASAVETKTPAPGKLLRSDSTSALAHAAQQGLGVALVSWPLGRNWFADGSLVRVFDEEVSTGLYFFLAVRPEDQHRNEVSRLCDWLLSEFKTTSEKK